MSWKNRCFLLAIALVVQLAIAVPAFAAEESGDALASFYGPPYDHSSTRLAFPGAGRLDDTITRLTPTGQPVTANRPIFAHKKMKRGTLVRFTYRGKTVIGICLDRGPYIRGREFDLGPQLVRDLGFDRDKGVDEVYYEVIGVAPKGEWKSFGEVVNFPPTNHCLLV